MRISDWSSDVCSSDLCLVWRLGRIWGAAVQLRSAAARLWRKENWQKRWTGSSLRLKQWVYRRGSALAFAARRAAFAEPLPDRPCQGLPVRRMADGGWNRYCPAAGKRRIIVRPLPLISAWGLRWG